MPCPVLPCIKLHSTLPETHVLLCLEASPHEITCSQASMPHSQVPTCLVFENDDAVTKADCPWTEGRDQLWQEQIPSQSSECEVEWMDAEDPLFLLYTSGSTGKPKGVLHTTGQLCQRLCQSLGFLVSDCERNKACSVMRRLCKRDGRLVLIDSRSTCLAWRCLMTCVTLLLGLHITCIHSPMPACSYCCKAIPHGMLTHSVNHQHHSQCTYFHDICSRVFTLICTCICLTLYTWSDMAHADTGHCTFDDFVQML